MLSPNPPNCSSAHTGGRPRSRETRQVITKDFSQGREGPGYHLQLCWVLLTTANCLPRESSLGISGALRKNVSKCFAKFGLMLCWLLPKSQGCNIRTAAGGSGGRSSWSRANLNALQLSPLLILCWFRENVKQKYKHKIIPSLFPKTLSCLAVMG